MADVHDDFGLGRSPAFLDACDLLARAASSTLPLLVCGETGTGKERAARAVHARSGRPGTFVAINCGALPDALLEAELFGHARGAYTGAGAPRAGLVAEAERGTLFLDEIGEASPAFQVRLLRVLAEGRYRRLGETRERAADLRIVAATHRDLARDVSAGRFRDDLWYRLAAVEVTLPPLRARGRDVVTLARSILARVAPGARFDPSARAALLRHAWPGNVRELESAIARAALFAEPDGTLGVGALPPRVRAGSAGPAPRSLAAARAEFEQGRIAEALAATRGARGAAARALGMSRQGLWKKLKRETALEGA